MPSRASAAPAFLYVPGLGSEGSETELSDSESHYVSRVCRARLGDIVHATDGEGRIATLRLTAIERAVRATVDRVETVARPRHSWLLCGEPEGNRDDWMVEKLAELGVSRWTPLDVTRARWGNAERRRERWERLAIAALRQSRSAYLMRVEEPRRLDDAIAAEAPPGTRWLASERGSGPGPAGVGGPLTAIVGPAAGLTPDEEAWARERGFVAVSLSHSRLRAETAAICVASWWAAQR